MIHSPNKHAHPFAHKLGRTMLLYFSLLLLLPLSSAMAHKVRVFAYENGGEIFTEAKFNNGRPAKNSTIIVLNHTDGSELLRGATDNAGFFRFSIPPEARKNHLDLDITLDVGEGHKGSWLLSASDYLAAEIEATTQAEPSPPIPPGGQTSNKNNNCKNLELVIESIIEKELAPVKRALAESQKQNLKLQDILGGLGYIFGLAGVAAYFQSKKVKGEK